MKALALLAFGFGFALLGAFTGVRPASAVESRPNRPNAISLEAFGRTLAHSLNYDRAAGPDWVVGLGVSKLGVRAIGGADLGESALLIPIYANYYIERDFASLFMTVGATIMMNGAAADRESASGNLLFPDNALIPSFGVGYESRASHGFLFRVTGYLVIGKSIAPWVGASFGFAF